jgi:hypothetical protein
MATGSASARTSGRLIPSVRAAGALLLAALIVAGCGGSRPAVRLFAVADVLAPGGDFEASKLLRVDPGTLLPLDRHGLHLGDAVTSRALSPDGRTVAFGGTNFGEVLYVDLSHPTRVRREKIVATGHEDDTGVEIDVEGWPMRSRLIAVATVDGVWWGPHPSQLLVVDPQRRRVVRRAPLHGTVLASVSTRDRTIALLVVRGSFPRVVVVRPDGSTWTRSLRRLDLGGRDGVRLHGDYYRPERVPALATDGRGTVLVAAPDRPIAEIRLRTHELRYHDVSLPRRYLAYPPLTEPGSGGINLRFSASAAWLGDHELAIGGFDELPGWIRGFGAGHRFPSRVLQIVDTRSWRRTRSVHASSCRPFRGVVLCYAATGGYPPDGKDTRGPSLVAYDRRWIRLYEKRSSQLWWDVKAGRLVAGSPEGRHLAQLDPATGRVVRKLEPPIELWPLDLLAWTPPR